MIITIIVKVGKDHTVFCADRDEPQAFIKDNEKQGLLFARVYNSRIDH